MHKYGDEDYYDDKKEILKIFLKNTNRNISTLEELMYEFLTKFLKEIM